MLQRIRYQDHSINKPCYLRLGFEGWSLFSNGWFETVDISHAIQFTLRTQISRDHHSPTLPSLYFAG